MEDNRVIVGSNSLIIENIVKFCEKETQLTCRLVNSTWGTATLKYLRLCNRILNDNGEAEPNFEVLLEQPLNPFQNIAVYDTIQPKLLDYLGPSLKSLDLYRVTFSDVTELSTVLFYTFPNMKELTLDAVAVTEKEEHVLYCGSDEISPVTNKLESLTIYLLTDSVYYPYGKESGVSALGLHILLQKFNKITTLKLDAGNYDPFQDVFDAMLQANVTPAYLKFKGCIEEPDMMEEYLTQNGGHLMHVLCNNISERGTFRNVDVGGWLSVRMDGANWNTFGHGNFESLLKLELVPQIIECFDFLHRMPVVEEIKFVLIGSHCMVAEVPPVTALDRNPPCKSVSTLDFDGRRPDSRQELYFHVFPNVKKLHLSCNKHFLSELVTRWANLTKLHLEYICDADVDAAFVTDMVTRLKDLEDFAYYYKDVTFGDPEAAEFVLHSKLAYLRLGRVSMSSLWKDVLKRKLMLFEFFGTRSKEEENFERAF